MDKQCMECQLVHAMDKLIKSKNAALKIKDKTIKSKDELIAKQRKMLAFLMRPQQLKLDFMFN